MSNHCVISMFSIKTHVSPTRLPSSHIYMILHRKYSLKVRMAACIELSRFHSSINFIALKLRIGSHFSSRDKKFDEKYKSERQVAAFSIFLVVNKQENRILLFIFLNLSNLPMQNFIESLPTQDISLWFFFFFFNIALSWIKSNKYTWNPIHQNLS